MSPNSDNAMARFLFAILKQKNLKDIDWNLVAQDPVLLQPISNGHAARMRYSRFRATVSNHEGRSSKNKTSDKSSRVTKSKSKRDCSYGSIKSEGSIGHIKQEYSGQTPMSHYSPASTTSPYLSDNQDFNTRFLTPCSDDMAQGLSVNPAALEGVSRAPPAFSPSLEFINPGQIHSPAFSAFDDATFDMTNFAADSQVAHHTEDYPDWSDRLHTQF